MCIIHSADSRPLKSATRTSSEYSAIARLYFTNFAPTLSQFPAIFREPHVCSSLPNHRRSPPRLLKVVRPVQNDGRDPLRGGTQDAGRAEDFQGISAEYPQTDVGETSTTAFSTPVSCAKQTPD